MTPLRMGRTYVCVGVSRISADNIELCKEENLEYAMQGLKFIQDMYNVE